MSLLDALNAASFEIRPKSCANCRLEEGLWFFPGEDAHCIMKWLSSATERHVRASTNTLRSISVTLGRPLASETEEITTVVVFSLSLPESQITGVCDLSIEAYTSHKDELKPFFELAKRTVSSVEDLEEAVDMAFPAIMALTY